MESAIIFLIDVSGSMADDKIQYARKVLQENIVPSLDYTSKIGVNTFTSVNKDIKITQLAPLGITDQPTLIKQISELNAIKGGGTPISAAIRESVNTLKEFPSNKKSIILVTDGEEDQGGNYQAECKRAQEDGIQCEIHIIGIGLKQTAIQVANEIAKLTKGSASVLAFKTGVPLEQQPSAFRSLTPFFTATGRMPLSKPIQNSAGPNPIPAILKRAEPLPNAPNLRLSETVTPDPNEAEIHAIAEPLNLGLKPLSESVQQLDSNSIDLILLSIKEVKDEIREFKRKSELFIVEENAELNEKIRQASEKYLNELLERKYPGRVKWLNESGESFSDHDFEITDQGNSVEYYIECKGTSKNKPTFYLTKQEWMLFLNNTPNYQIYFVQNVFENPSIIFINNLLDWFLRGKLLPYLLTPETIKEERVFLTVSNTVMMAK